MAKKTTKKSTAKKSVPATATLHAREMRIAPVSKEAQKLIDEQKAERHRTRFRPVSEVREERAKAAAKKSKKG